MRAFSHFLCTVRSDKFLQGGDFGEGEPAEKLQVDQFGELQARLSPVDPAHR